MEIVDVTDAGGMIIAPELLQRIETVHRQLRPKLIDYAATIRRVCKTGGRLCAAVTDDAVLGVALYRVYETTFDGRRLHIDDLVTDEAHRSKGVGHALLEHLQAKAEKEGCDTLSLESGTHRHRAHQFYFREGMTITSFSFRTPLVKQNRLTQRTL